MSDEDDFRVVLPAEPPDLDDPRAARAVWKLLRSLATQAGIDVPGSAGVDREAAPRGPYQPPPAPRDPYPEVTGATAPVTPDDEEEAV